MRNKSASLTEMKVKVRLLEEFQNKERTDTDSLEAMACPPLGNFKLRGDSSISWIPLWFAVSMEERARGRGTITSQFCAPVSDIISAHPQRLLTTQVRKVIGVAILHRRKTKIQRVNYLVPGHMASK